MLLTVNVIAALRWYCHQSFWVLTVSERREVTEPTQSLAGELWTKQASIVKGFMGLELDTWQDSDRP
jgi:hypothetical protein